MCTENGRTDGGLYLTRVQRMGDRWRTVLNACTENGRTDGGLYSTRVQRMGDRWRTVFNTIIHYVNGETFGTGKRWSVFRDGPLCETVRYRVFTVILFKIYQITYCCDNDV